MTSVRCHHSLTSPQSAVTTVRRHHSQTSPSLTSDNEPRCSGELAATCTRGVCCFLYNVKLSPLPPVSPHSLRLLSTSIPPSSPDRQEAADLVHLTDRTLSPANSSPPVSPPRITSSTPTSDDDDKAVCHRICCSGSGVSLSPIPAHVLSSSILMVAMSTSSSNNSSLCFKPVPPPRHNFDHCPLSHTLDCSVCNLVLERATYNMP